MSKQLLTLYRSTVLVALALPDDDEDAVGWKDTKWTVVHQWDQDAIPEVIQALMAVMALTRVGPYGEYDEYGDRNPVYWLNDAGVAKIEEGMACATESK
jgi:hypothetical protein